MIMSGNKIYRKYSWLPSGSILGWCLEERIDQVDEIIPNWCAFHAEDPECMTKISTITTGVMGSTVVGFGGCINGRGGITWGTGTSRN
ncbi:hypothetical protein BVC80_9081g38 [Macleaya cordata]|uniref:Uncharacterized protein n=1 Tax=Macleaya cordata TaxID=56857 RepID=A0A200PRQ7_MACCD|nr:hypothetical protein BVC80_9081g38 [Macleaya cordata]